LPPNPVSVCPESHHLLTVIRFANTCTSIEMIEPIDLPPEVRELFPYALVLAMIDDERARVLGTRMQDWLERLTIETVEGGVFEIVRPPISEEVEAELMQ
jgi:hypothetical protein